MKSTDRKKTEPSEMKGTIFSSKFPMSVWNILHNFKTAFHASRDHEKAWLQLLK